MKHILRLARGNLWRVDEQEYSKEYLDHLKRTDPLAWQYLVDFTNEYYEGNYSKSSIHPPDSDQSDYRRESYQRKNTTKNDVVTTKPEDVIARHGVKRCPDEYLEFDDYNTDRSITVSPEEAYIDALDRGISLDSVWEHFSDRPPTEHKLDTTNAARIYTNTIALLLKGTFPGELAPAVAEAVEFLNSIKSEIDKVTNDQQDAPAAKQASPKTKRRRKSPSTGDE